MANEADDGLFEWKGEGEKTHPGLSLGQFTLDHLRKHAREADFPAQVDAVTGNELSFSSLLDLSVTAAEGWRALGLGPGSTLTIIARNSELLFPAVLGALFQGVTLSGVSPTATEGELRHCLSPLRPQAIVCDPDNVELCSRVAAAILPAPCLVLVQSPGTAAGGATGGPPPPWAGYKSLDEVFQAASNAPIDVESYRPADVGDLREHVVCVLFSSGTTGLPKAIELSNYGFIMSTLDSTRAFRCIRGERLLCAALMSWVTGIGLLVCCTVAGTTRVYDTFTSPAATLASLRRHEVNCWFTAPPLLLLVAEVVRSEAGRDPGTAPCPSLRAVVAGGTTLPAAVEEATAKVMHCDIHQVYASTEALAVTSSVKPLRPGSAGKIVSGISVRFVDLDTGRDIRTPGVPGELRIASPAIMKGYKENAVATAEAFDQHGFLRTGDIAYLDEGGYLFIVGRVKELLKYMGTGVVPAEVEAVLREHPGVADACVVGRPHPICGDVPAAVVVRRPGHEVSERELQQLVADRLSSRKRLRGGVVFINQIPKTSNGKVSRKDVVSLFDGAPMTALD